MFGMLAIDIIYYLITIKGGRFAARVIRKLDNHYLNRLKKKGPEHKLKNLFILSLIPKLRQFAPVYAGTAEIPWKKFVLIDLLSTQVVALAGVYAGVFFYKRLQDIFKELEYMRHFTFLLFLVVLFVISFFLFRKGLRKNIPPKGK
jgi:membrane protein DedA with SNARE-associated domain